MVIQDVVNTISNFWFAHNFTLLCFTQSVFQQSNRRLFSWSRNLVNIWGWGRGWESPSKLLIPGLLKVAFILFQVKLSWKWTQRRAEKRLNKLFFYSKVELYCIHYLFVYHQRIFLLLICYDLKGNQNDNMEMHVAQLRS